MVLAPKAYFSKNDVALKEAKRLLERLKAETHCRIALCYSDDLPEKVTCFSSNWCM